MAKIYFDISGTFKTNDDVYEMYLDVEINDKVEKIRGQFRHFEKQQIAEIIINKLKNDGYEL